MSFRSSRNNSHAASTTIATANFALSDLPRHSQFVLQLQISCLFSVLAATFCLSSGLAAKAVPLPLEIAQVPQAQDVSQMNLLYVSASNGNDTGDGSRNAPFKTITHALKVAGPNTAILLAPGTYNSQTGEIFPLYLPSNVTLQGNPNSRGKEIIIEGGGHYVSPTAASQEITLLGANGARLSGITVTNPNYRGYGLWIESSSMVVTNNTFVGNTHDGISMVGSGTSLVQGNLFSDNGANGITIFGSSQPEVRDNEFQHTGFGINISQNAAPVIIGNRITFNKDGVVVQANARPVLRQNYIERNERDGIVAIAQSLPDLGTAAEPGGNIIRNNGRYDVNNAVKAAIPAYGNQLAGAKTTGEIDIAGSFTAPKPTTAIANRFISQSTVSRPEVASASLNSMVYSPPTNRMAAIANRDNAAPPGSNAIPIPVPPPANPESASRDVPITRLPPVVAQARRRLTASNPTPEPSATRPLLPPRRATTQTAITINNAVLEPSATRPLLPPRRSTTQTAITIPVPPPESGVVTTNRRTQPPVSIPSPSRENQGVESQGVENQGEVAAAGLLRVPAPDIPIGSGGYIPPGLSVPANVSSSDEEAPPAYSIAALGLRYRVIVDISNAADQSRIKALIPEAFLTTYQGKTVMQAGVFQRRDNADTIMELLTNNGLKAKIEPVN